MFGNLVGETGDGRSGDWTVSVVDVARTRAAAVNPSAVASNVFDFNKDRRVDFADVQIARAAHGKRLERIAIPVPVAAAAASSPATPATDLVRRRGEYGVPG